MTTKAKNGKQEASKELVRYEYGTDAGSGFENQRPDEIQVPFLALLQAQSPQVLEGKEGAKAGKLFNTVTGTVFPDTVLFVPACKQRQVVEWIPRDQGGGLVARHDLDSEVVAAARAKAKEFGKLKHENGNDLVDTIYVYGVVCGEDGSIDPAVVSFSSTKLTVYKRWNTALTMFKIPGGDRPPLFAHLVRIGSVAQKNKKGSFFNFTLEPANGPGKVASSLINPDDARYRAAREIRDLVASGAAKAAEETRDGAAAEEEATDGVF